MSRIWLRSLRRVPKTKARLAGQLGEICPELPRAEPPNPTAAVLSAQL